MCNENGFQYIGRLNTRLIPFGLPARIILSTLLGSYCKHRYATFMGIYADFDGNIDTVLAVNYNSVEFAVQKVAASAVHHRARYRKG